MPFCHCLLLQAPPHLLPSALGGRARAVSLCRGSSPVDSGASLHTLSNVMPFDARLPLPFVSGASSYSLLHQVDRLGLVCPLFV